MNNLTKNSVISEQEIRPHEVNCDSMAVAGYVLEQVSQKFEGV